MGIYYRTIADEGYRDALQVIKTSFSTVEKELGIDRDSFQSFGSFYTYQQLKTHLSKGVTFIGAYDSTKASLIGLIGYVRIKCNKGRIMKLSVMPEYRHLGVGKRLMFEAECKCFNLGCKAMTLGYIRENQVLNEWYLALGYKKLSAKAYKQTGFHIVSSEVQLDHLVKIVERYGFEFMKIDEDNQGLIQCSRQVNVLLIYSASEVMRGSNTGYLSQQLLTNSIMEFIWQRSSDVLLKHFIEERLGKDVKVVLVYKHSDYSKLYRSVNQTLDGQMLYIVLDGTWQEARDIYNQSMYLKSLAIMNVQSDKESNYSKRRNQVEGGLCTAEVVGEAIKPHIPIEMYETYATIIDSHI